MQTACQLKSDPSSALLRSVHFCGSGDAEAAKRRFEWPHGAVEVLNATFSQPLPVGRFASLRWSDSLQPRIRLGRITPPSLTSPWLMFIPSGTAADFCGGTGMSLTRIWFCHNGAAGGISRFDRDLGLPSASGVGAGHDRRCRDGAGRIEMTVASLLHHTDGPHTRRRRTFVGMALVAGMAVVHSGGGLRAAERVDPDAVTTLTAEQATMFLRRPGPLEFNSLQSLEPEAAAILARHKNVVKLNALATIGEATAAALAKATGEIQLNGLSQLSEPAALALSKSEGFVTLEGLKTLESVPLARRLAAYKTLRLPQLTDFRDDVAEVIGAGLCRLEAPGLKVLEQPAIAAALVRPAGASVSLRSLARLSPEAAEKLCGAPGDLALPAFLKIDAAVADKLRNHQGVLDLGNLRDVDPEALAALLGNQGPLDLGSITSLGGPAPKNVLDALARHRGPLCLNGLPAITLEEARAIAEHQGPVELGGITVLPREVAIELGKCKGLIWLQGLQALEPDVAKHLLGRQFPAGAGFVFSQGLPADLPPYVTEAFEKNEGIHFGNPYNP